MKKYTYVYSSKKKRTNLAIYKSLREKDFEKEKDKRERLKIGLTNMSFNLGLMRKR